MKIPLHIKIIIGFILGIIFGFTFPNQKNIEIKTADRTYIIKDVLKVSFYGKKNAEFTAQNIKKDFSTLNKSIRSEDYSSVVFKTKKEEMGFKTEEIKHLKLKKNIYDIFDVIGKLFIKILQMISIPLVISSLISGVGSMGDLKKLKKIASFALIFYFLSTVIAIILGLFLVNIFKPGVSSNIEISNTVSAFTGETIFDIKNFIIDIIPSNPFKALAEGNMLQIIFFSFVIGIIINFISKEKTQIFLKITDTLSEIMINTVIFTMKIAHIAVFCLISSVISDAGIDMIKKMFFYMAVVISGLIIYLFGFYSIYIKLMSKTKVIDFFKGIKDVIMVAFGTSSSAAALPVNFECCEKNLGISKNITGFVLPLGATVNMNGTAMYQAIAAVFIAQIYGIDLSLNQQIIIVVMAVAAAIGSSPIPGVGIIMLLMILNSVGIPSEGIAIIIGVDRILDMFRTVVNVAGDSVACIIANDMFEKNNSN